MRTSYLSYLGRISYLAWAKPSQQSNTKTIGGRNRGIIRGINISEKMQIRQQRESMMLDEIKEKMDKALERDKHYLDPGFSSTELSMIVGTNRTYLYKALTKHNHTYIQYINIFRTNHAVRLLKNEANSNKLLKSIPQIAYESGFGNERTMNKYLLHFLGMRASEIRRQARREKESVEGL